jgi:hypothetical protein
MAATWPALTPRGSAPGRHPGTDGTAAASGCATRPVSCKKRSSERSALTSDRMSPGLRRCAWDTVKEVTAAAVRPARSASPLMPSPARNSQANRRW